MISKDLNVCLYPMAIEWDEIDKNLDTLESALATVHKDTDILILPETFSTGFPAGKTSQEIKRMIGNKSALVIERIKKLSHKHNLAICGTIVFPDESDRLRNRAFFIEPTGDENYADKKHLFSMAGEEKIFTAGSNRMKVRFRGWNIAMVICYDIRFPIWCRNRENEYDLLIAVANWPDVRVSAWNTLLTARAIENLAYVCGVNCTGTDTQGFKYGGNSTSAIDFKGKDISIRQTGCEILYATLSRTKLDSFREKFPAWKDADDFSIHSSLD